MQTKESTQEILRSGEMASKSEVEIFRLQEIGEEGDIQKAMGKKKNAMSICLRRAEKMSKFLAF